MRSAVKSHLYVLLATLLIAGSFLASARLAGEINPFSLTLLRFVAAALLLVPVVMSRRRWRARILSTLPRAMVISLFYALFFACLFQALTTTTTLHTGTLYTLVPFMTALLCWVLFRQRINGRSTLIYALGAVATCWVIFEGRWDLMLAFRLNEGDALFLLGAILICGYSLSMKILYRSYDVMVVLVFCILVSGALWMGLALWLVGQPLDWGRLHGGQLWAMAYLVVGSTLMTVYLYQRSTVELGPRRVMAYIYLNPAIVALLMWALEGAQIAPILWPGILLSAIATIVLQRGA